MRIMNRHELMRQPAGVVYAPWDPCILGHLMVKGETISSDGVNIDWFESCLGPDVDTNTNELVLDDGSGREACYDDELRYVVLDATDMDILIAKLLGTYSGEPATRVNFDTPE